MNADRVVQRSPIGTMEKSPTKKSSMVKAGLSTESHMMVTKSQAGSQMLIQDVIPLKLQAGCQMMSQAGSQMLNVAKMLSEIRANVDADASYSEHDCSVSTDSSDSVVDVTMIDGQESDDGQGEFKIQTNKRAEKRHALSPQGLDANKN